MELIIRYLLEFIVIIPGIFFAYLPVRKYARIHSVLQPIAVFSCAIIYSIICSVICYKYNLKTNQILLYCVPAFFYFLLVKLDFFKLLFCFFGATLLTAFSTMYTNYLTAPIELDNVYPTFEIPSSLVCLGLNVIVFLVFLKAFTVWLPFLLEDEVLNNIWKIAFIVPLVFTIFTFWLVPRSPKNVMVGRIYGIGLSIFGILLFIIWFLVYISYLLSKNHRKYSVIIRENDMLTAEERRYKEFKKYYDQTRSLRHDFRQHLLILHRFATEEKYTELQEYLLTLNDKIDNSPEHLCANTAIDAIATYYKNMALSHEIQIKYNLQLPENLPWPEMELCIVLGNLLENSVRETAKVDPGKRKITVTSSFISDEMLGLSVENPYDGKITLGSDGLPTSKNIDHGIGLHSVATTVARLNGNMDIKTDNNMFVVNILLFCPTQ